MARSFFGISDSINAEMPPASEPGGRPPTADNRIFAVPQTGSRTGSSGRGAIIFQDDHLRGPLALVFAPNGNLLTANGDTVNDDPTQPSEIVESTRTGRFVVSSIMALCWPATPSEVKFAADSLLEGAGFEPSVPPQKEVGCRSPI